MGVDHEAACIEFEHEALLSNGRGGPVAVRQDLSGANVAQGRDATARWVWDAAAPMATWMCEHPHRVAGKTVVELGAGPGMPGIVAARLGARRVTLTDLPSELALPRLNARENGVEAAVDVAPCTWGDAEAIAALGTFDVVVCSDVLYGHRAEVAAQLARTARALCHADGRESVVLVAYFSREKLLADVPFFDVCDELFEAPKQHAVGGVAEDDEDLWFFEYRPKASPLEPADAGAGDVI